MVLAGLGGRFTASCDGLGWIVGLVRVLAGDSDSRLNDSLDLEGPSFAATTPRLSKNFLNSYLAGETPSEYWQWGDVSGVNVFYLECISRGHYPVLVRSCSSVAGS
jgi:hypothetical protein